MKKAISASCSAHQHWRGCQFPLSQLHVERWVLWHIFLRNPPHILHTTCYYFIQFLCRDTIMGLCSYNALLLVCTWTDVFFCKIQSSFIFASLLLHNSILASFLSWCWYYQHKSLQRIRFYNFLYFACYLILKSFFIPS